MNWLLPEYIADALPAEAARIERLRRTVLDHFRGHGYEFVMPPMLEYLESLLTGLVRIYSCALSNWSINYLAGQWGSRRRHAPGSTH